MSQVFLLSPARCDGERAKLLLNPRASFELAERVRGAGAPIGEVFSFLSGLYFRGKLGYARAFGNRGHGEPSVFIITTDRGLVSPEEVVTRDDLLAFATVDIATADSRYHDPLRRDVADLAHMLGHRSRAVLLGSIATGKYVDALLAGFGSRLVFPRDFVGRGDMSRGGLLLRCVREQRELDYVPVEGAVRRGKLPPRLAPER